MPNAEPTPAAPGPARVTALDAMRGLVMALMAVDHASAAFNAGRLFTDSFFMYRPGTPLPAAQFATRWITHLCAPTFVFLAGAALALSAERRLAAGDPPRSIDRFILTRGLFIAALDPLWMSWIMVGPGNVLLQVLYTIGLSLVCMALLRRLPTRAMLALALVLLLGGEALVGLIMALSGGQPSIPAALVLTGGQFMPLVVAYPVLGWLPVMLLGWAFGRVVGVGPASAPAARPERWLVPAGAASLGLFVVVRGLNRYGNMLLPREDGSLVQWLHVSKYPPSLSFMALELGLMALCLAALFALSRRAGAARWLAPLLVFGQTALFFYVLHIHLLELSARALGVHHRLGLAAAYAGALAVLVLLYPLCARYGRYKRAHPNGWTRYL